jgi:hypothetical protein
MFNVITPLARFGNIKDLKNILKSQGIRWHAVSDHDNKTQISFNEDWINHCVCPNNGTNFWERSNIAINWFIDTYEINDEEYYCILNDDDGYEQGFFHNLQKLIENAVANNKNADLVIVSMKRGYRMPPDLPANKQHGTSTLYAEPDHMQVGHVSVEQFFIKGKLLKKHRLPLTICGDGELIVELVNTYEPLYLPDIYVLFNYLEPGRWDVPLPSPPPKPISLRPIPNISTRKLPTRLQKYLIKKK